MNEAFQFLVISLAIAVGLAIAPMLMNFFGSRCYVNRTLSLKMRLGGRDKQEIYPWLETHNWEEVSFWDYLRYKGEDKE